MDKELVQYLDERFDGIDRRFEQVDRQFAEMRGEMRDGQEDVKRHAGILIEDLRRQLQLVAEGLITHIDVRHAEDRAYTDEHFRENRSLFKLCFQRLENLERKGQG